VRFSIRWSAMVLASSSNFTGFISTTFSCPAELMFTTLLRRSSLRRSSSRRGRSGRSSS